jgi:hypothetical protein
MTRWIGAAFVMASLVVAGQARADPLRILVAASHGRGAPGELALRHAGADVERVERVLTTLGDFRPEDVIHLADPTLAELYAAFDRARALAAGHAPGEVTFVFYFSGHGDRDRIHLGDETVAMADVAARARAVPASLRLLVTDACRNYPTRFKGVTTEPGFAIDNPGGGEADGVVWLFASGEGEPAQESDELQGALFTHYWVSSLRGAGDANGDGRVTLAESYDFAYSQTLLRSARSSGVLQHPAAVFDLREAAPIVLTKTFAADTLLRLPQAADAHYLVYSLGSRAVLGEIWGSADREAVFALPPGHYLVQRRSQAGSGGVEVSLARGQVLTLHASDFRAAPEEMLASKGGTFVLRPRELGVEVTAGATRLSSYGGAVEARYAHAWDEWAIAVGVGGGYGSQTTSAEQEKLTSLGASTWIERRWHLEPFGFALGAGVEGDVFQQSLERTDAARVGAAGYLTTQVHVGFAPGPIATAHARLPMGPAFWIELTARGGVLFANFGSGLGALWTARAGLAAGVDF